MRRETPTRECKCGSTMTTHGGRKACLDCRYEQFRSPEFKARAIIHQLVNRAIAAGKLVRQPCEVCGAVKVDAHHDDYSKPLEVRWLCRTHHKQHHNTVNRGANHMKPIYLVEVQNRIGRFFIECDRDSNSLAGILDQIRSGEINPVKILEVDEEMNRVEDITAEVMSSIALPDGYRAPLAGEELAAWEADRRRAIEMAE